MVIAIDVTTTGEKRLLGLVQTVTEDARVIVAFLRELVKRGFQTPTELQAAYAKCTYAEAHRALLQQLNARESHNASAARSIAEGLDETLTLHRLEVFTQHGISFKTMNLIESVRARLEAKPQRITLWRTSDQKQRWCAATMLKIGKQFRKPIPRLTSGCAVWPNLATTRCRVSSVPQAPIRVSTSLWTLPTPIDAPP